METSLSRRTLATTRKWQRSDDFVDCAGSSPTWGWSQVETTRRATAIYFLCEAKPRGGITGLPAVPAVWSHSATSLWKLAARGKAA